MTFLWVLLCSLAATLAAALVLMLRRSLSVWFDRRRYGSPGRLVDVGGYRLHMVQTGRGEGPTVVLLTGRTLPAVLWYPVQQALGREATVVSYDRPGYGLSDSVTMERTGPRVAEELHTLLERAHVPGPFMLVGHSLGGAYARLFAARYPQEVVGLVLVDAPDEFYRQRVPDEMKVSEEKVWRVMRWMSRLGLFELALRFKPGLFDGGKGVWLKRLPADIRAAVRWMMYHPRLIDASAAETAQFDHLDAELGRARDLGALPLVVLSRARPDLGGWGYTPEQQAKLWAILQEGQASFLELSADSRQMIVEDSGHNIPIEQPEAIVQAVKDLLGRVNFRTDS